MFVGGGSDSAPSLPISPASVTLDVLAGRREAEVPQPRCAEACKCFPVVVVLVVGAGEG